MKKYKVILLLCYLCFGAANVFAQRTKNKQRTIEVGQIITFYSKILSEDRQIYISLPPGYDTLRSTLPVVYVLDAESRFTIAQSVQSYFAITTKIPPAILVGISNPTPQARQRDYLPTSYGGQAKNFTKFLSEELFAFVEHTFKANQHRYIAGHSHGGVFVIYTLLNNPHLFRGYIATDPSLKHIYQKADTLLNRDLAGKRLYLASSDIAYGYLEDVAADMQADFAVFKNNLYQTRDKNKLTFKIDHIQDDHGNSFIQGFSRGLRYIFNWRFE